jgi:hypothetical protein
VQWNQFSPRIRQKVRVAKTVLTKIGIVDNEMRQGWTYRHIINAHLNELLSGEIDTVFLPFHAELHFFDIVLHFEMKTSPMRIELYYQDSRFDEVRGIKYLNLVELYAVLYL